jgi:uncharacterized DUF497 family protein
MRFHFDERKSSRLGSNPKRGIGFEEAREVFSHPYYLDQRSDWPEQYRAIGWVGERLSTILFEIREDEQGEYYQLVTLWKATTEERKNFMTTIRKPRKRLSAEAIARLADQGKDVSRFFTNTGQMMGPIQRVNVDLAPGMLAELDQAAKDLNISRQAVIKTLIRQALDQQYRARDNRALAKRR